MAAYGIMRIEKRGRSAIYGLQIEANRTPQDHHQGRDFDNSDIDWTKTKDNIHIIRTVSWNKEITRRIKQLGLKERKDSVVLLDALYTASPEWFATHTRQQMLEYFRDCLHFHVREFCGGDKSLLLNAVIHLDEATPHMAVASLPVVTDEKGAHLSAKIIMGNKEDYRIRQDRFFDEVSSHYDMERGEQKQPGEIKAHTTKRDWQIATQENNIDDLQTQKELLEFDINSLTSTRRYEHRKTEQAKQQRQDIENEINTLVEKQNQLQEYLNRNIDVVKNWKNEVESKIKSINEVVDEYEGFSNEMEKQYSAEVREYILNALGNVPDDAYEMVFNPPVTGFTSYSGEEYDLER